MYIFDINIFNLACNPPAIQILSQTSSITYPMRFRRSEDFYILTNVQLRCNKSLSAVTQWTISNCSAINCSRPISISKTIITTFSELYIPARVLPYGIYELKLTVTMVVSSNLTTSASTYVEIVPSDIKINLVPYGMSMITRGYQQHLILNPGEYSLNIDGYNFDSRVIYIIEKYFISFLFCL